jgi:hypothetical protein
VGQTASTLLLLVGGTVNAAHGDSPSVSLLTSIPVVASLGGEAHPEKINALVLTTGTSRLAERKPD